MNDQYRELLRQYFQARDRFLVAVYVPIEQKLRAAVLGQDRPGPSREKASAGAAEGASAG